MPGFEFSVPYNGDMRTIPEILALQGTGRNRIREIFLSGPADFAGSGRVAPGITIEEFGDLCDMVHDAGVRVNLVLNSVCEGIEWYTAENMNQLMGYLNHAHRNLGVEALTVANPIIIALVRDHFPDMEVSASVLSQVDCVHKAKSVLTAGAKVCTPDVNINRDMDMLKRIADTGLELKVMVNEGCMRGCAYRQFHFNAMSHLAKDVSHVGVDADPQAFYKTVNQIAFKLFFGNCNHLLDEDHAALLKSGWIRPEDVKQYAGVTHFFKISGRTIPREQLVRLVRAYMEESYEGNFFDLMDSSLKTFAMRHGAHLDNKALGDAGLFSQLSTCGERCETCSWCRDTIDELLELER